MEVTFDKAIEIIKNGGKLELGTKVTQFWSLQLIQTQDLSDISTYNYNFYSYKGNIILEVGNDDNQLKYFLCDSNLNELGELGYRYDNEYNDDRYTNLYIGY